MCINHPKTSFTIKESKHRHYGYSMSTMSVFDDKKKNKHDACRSNYNMKKHFWIVKRACNVDH